jgi:hypothetical protein
MDGIIHTGNENYVLSKDSDMKLTLSSSSSMQRSPLIKEVIFKDERLDYLDIPKGLVEVLQTNGFTVEKILEYGPSQIEEILRIDPYVAQIIFNETTKGRQPICYNEFYPEDENYYYLKL